MGCNHKQAVAILTATHKRPVKPISIVPEDRITVFICRKCGEIKGNTENMYVRAEGKWSSPNKDNIQRLIDFK